MALPEANSSTVRDLRAPSVSSLPLSVIVHSHFHRRVVRSLNMNLL